MSLLEAAKELSWCQQFYWVLHYFMMENNYLSEQFFIPFMVQNSKSGGKCSASPIL